MVAYLKRAWQRQKLLEFVYVLIAAGSACGAAPPEGDGSFRTTLKMDGGSIDVRAQQSLPVSQAEVTDWVQLAGAALTDFYGRFPVHHVTIFISPADDGAVQNGVESNGDRITISLGPRANSKTLSRDWMMTHEMFHLSQPQLEDDYSWMSEGMADYLEPVARVRLGQITPEQFWKDLVEGMPQGLPEPGDRGLDHTHTWGRTYWGGSLFWLLADVDIRKQTQNKKSVRDAALAVLNAGGNGSQDWTIARLLATYDRATGTTVFRDLHNQLGTKPTTTNLAALWNSLGVIYDQGRISFDDAAPLAEVRRGITRASER